MTFGRTVVDFFETLQPPAHLPPGVDILWPYGSREVRRVISAFYAKYFGDENERIFLVGINPGRFGAGVTGLCFTDPVRLNRDCGISHDLSGGRELSSDFVYRMIAAFAGPEVFYRRFYLTALSPVGFLRDGRNLNYYDVNGLPQGLDAWMAESMERQILAGACRKVAFSLGRGANFRFMAAFNDRHRFFDRIEPLPHPRWVMQYRRKRLDEFIAVYVHALSKNGD